VALELQQRGFKYARPLAGGFSAWRDRGLPLTEATVGPQSAVSNG
jgi:rhodanese-related sulfurtransferase